MKAAILVTLLGIVYGDRYSNNYNKGGYKGRPEIPDDFFSNPIHNFDGVFKGPLPEKRLPNIRIPDFKSPDILTGDDLLDRHREKLEGFIGTNILEKQKNPYDYDNDYYKGNNDDSIRSHMRRWYRPPNFPEPKGERRPHPRPKGPPFKGRTTEAPIDTTQEVTTQAPITTVEPITTEEETTTTITPAICSFGGQYELPIGDVEVLEIDICEQNGQYFIGYSNGQFTESIGRGNRNNIQQSNDTEELIFDLMEIIPRNSNNAPCYEVRQQSIACNFDADPDEFRLDGENINKLSDIQDPQRCFQGGSFTDLNITDPIAFNNPNINHLTDINGGANNIGDGCFVENGPGESCNYVNVDQIFDDSVRIACCQDANNIFAAFFTPFDQDTAFGTTRVGVSGRDDEYEISNVSPLTCPLV